MAGLNYGILSVSNHVYTFKSPNYYAALNWNFSTRISRNFSKLTTSTLDYKAVAPGSLTKWTS